MLVSEHPELDLHLPFLNPLVGVKDLILDCGIEFGILRALPIASPIKYFLDQLVVVLGFDEVLNGPVNFILSQRLALLKANFAKGLFLKLGALTHNCCQMKMRWQLLTQRQRWNSTVCLVILAGLQRNAVAKLVLSCRRTSASIYCEQKYLSHHFSEVLLNECKVLRAELVHQ